MSANITKKISAGFNLMTTLHLPPLFQLPFGQSQFLGLAIYCLGQKIQEPDLWPFMNSNSQFYKVAVRSNYTEKIDLLLGKIWNGANDNNDIKKTGFFPDALFSPISATIWQKKELLFSGFYASNDLHHHHAQAPICMASSSNNTTANSGHFWAKAS